MVVACGASVFEPPPHPASTRSRARATVAEHAAARIMHGPPWGGIARRRILTDDLRTVNSRGCVRNLASLAALLAVLQAAPAAAEPVRRGDLHLLVVLAGFPDRPLAKGRSHFAGRRTSLVDRLVAYYAEVSSGRLRIVPTVGSSGSPSETAAGVRGRSTRSSSTTSSTTSRTS